MQKHPNAIWDEEYQMWIYTDDKYFDPREAADKYAGMYFTWTCSACGNEMEAADERCVFCANALRTQTESR